VLPELVRREVEIDVVTDQTSAHDPLKRIYSRRLFAGSRGGVASKRILSNMLKLSMASMAVHVEAMLAMQRRGSVAFDYGNNIRKRAFDAGCKHAFGYSGLSLRNIFVHCSAKAQVHFAGLRSREIPADIYRTDELALKLFPENEILKRWGFTLPGSAFIFKVCRHDLLVGLWRAGAHGRGYERVGSQRRAEKPQLPLAATISIPARLPRHTARQSR